MSLRIPIDPNVSVHDAQRAAHGLGCTVTYEGDRCYLVTPVGLHIYQGKPAIGVTVNGAPINPRFDLAEHSPTGLTWGYAGSGPAQTALAILAHEYGDEFALRHYQRFKREVIAGLDMNESFVLSNTDLRLWCRTLSL